MVKEVLWIIVSFNYLLIGAWTIWVQNYRDKHGHLFDRVKEVQEWTRGLTLHGVMFLIIGLSNGLKHISDNFLNGPSEAISAIALSSGVGVSGAVLFWQWQFTREMAQWKRQSEQSLQGVSSLSQQRSARSQQSGSGIDDAA